MDQNVWRRFPSEIIQIILSYMDGRSLLTCRLIDNVWKSNVDELLRRDDTWKIMCKTMLKAGGENTYLKSTLSWRNVYTNVLLWYKLNNETKYTTKHYFIKDTYVKFMRAYKDFLIIISDETVGYYKIQDLSLIRHLVIKCDDLIQNEYMIAIIVYENKDRQVWGKKKTETSEDLLDMSASSITIEDCSFFCMEDRHCYAITNKGHIWKYTWQQHTESWSSQFKARYYGSMTVVKGLEALLGNIYVPVGDCIMKVDEARGMLVNVGDQKTLYATYMYWPRQPFGGGRAVDHGCVVAWAQHVGDGDKCDLHIWTKHHLVERLGAGRCPPPLCTITVSLVRSCERRPRVTCVEVHESRRRHTVLLATRGTVYKVTFCHDGPLSPFERLSDPDGE